MNETKCSHPGCTHEKFEKNEKCIFHCEKTSWYEEKNGEKIWKEDLVKKFWEEIREEVEGIHNSTIQRPNNYHDFSFYIFPIFKKLGTTFWKRTRNQEHASIEKDYNFFQKDKYQNFQGYVNFRKAVFLDDASFENIHFNNNVSFTSCKFIGEVNFKNTIFKGKVMFDKEDEKEIEFYKKVYFEGTEFDGNANFQDVRFLQQAFFYQTKFHDLVDFSRVKFSEEKQTLFDQVEFSRNNEFTEEKKFKDPSAKFCNVIFPSPVVFRSCDLSYVSFLHSRVDNPYFDECDFLYDRELSDKGFWNNIFAIDADFMLWDEMYIKNKLKKSEKIDKKEFKIRETLYRRLKKNFEDKKDFSMSDDFYGGEMEMKLKYLEIEYIEDKKISKMASFQLLRIYKLFSDYNQNPIKSIIFLIFLVLVSAVCLSITFFQLLIVFVIILCLMHFPRITLMLTLLCVICSFYLSIPSDYKFFSYFIDLGKYFHIAFKNAVPLIKADIEDFHFSIFQYFILYIELFISTALWILFGLSLRRKFKR